SSMAEATPAAPICVTLKRDLGGTLFFVNDKAVSEAELTSALEEQGQLCRARGALPVVQLDAEKNLSYQEIYTALDRINRAGLNRVFLQARPATESSP
ncbi:MAG: biopolymer transporter ExbD, partial [Desulfobulbaceae bacterium]|nr:biopolymer transporter ExbD [Desulfobulbaceae bacterium]